MQKPFYQYPSCTLWLLFHFYSLAVFSTVSILITFLSTRLSPLSHFTSLQSPAPFINYHPIASSTLSQWYHPVTTFCHSLISVQSAFCSTFSLAPPITVYQLSFLPFSCLSFINFLNSHRCLKPVSLIPTYNE